MHALKTTLRALGYTHARLETSDQSVGYGFLLTSLRRGEEQVSTVETAEVTDDLEDEGLLDLDWEIGEDAHGVLELDLTKDEG